MRAAVVIDDKVENVIVVDDLESFSPPEGYLINADNGAAEIGWEVKDGKAIAPPPEPVNPADIRAKRDRLLRESDWVTIRAQELDSPVPQAWADYRQALRDVPQQSGFPETINWPTEPEEPNAP